MKKILLLLAGMLTITTIPSFSLYGASKDEICSICLESLGKAKKIKKITCMHQFHRNCIDQWLVNQDTCPLCRSTINSSDFFREEYERSFLLNGCYQAIHVATMFGHTEEVRKILRNGVDVNLRCVGGFTALHLAAEKGNTQIVSVLLDAHANPNLQTHYGETSLHLAVSLGCTEIVRLLLAAGADTSIVDRGGYTALRKALINGNLSIVAMIETQIASNIVDGYGCMIQ